MFRDARFVPKSGNALWIETANARLLLPAIGDEGHSKPPRIVECPVRVKPEMPPLARHFRPIPQSRHREAAGLNEPGSTAQGFPSSNALLAASPCQLASRTGPQNVEPRSHFANRPIRSHCRNQLVRCTIVFVAKGNSPTYGMNEPRPWKKSLLR